MYSLQYTLTPTHIHINTDIYIYIDISKDCVDRWEMTKYLMTISFSPTRSSSQSIADIERSLFMNIVNKIIYIMWVYLCISVHVCMCTGYICPYLIVCVYVFVLGCFLMSMCVHAVCFSVIFCLTFRSSICARVYMSVTVCFYMSICVCPSICVYIYISKLLFIAFSS